MESTTTKRTTIVVENVRHADVVTVHLDLNCACGSSGSYVTTSTD